MARFIDRQDEVAKHEDAILLGPDQMLPDEPDA